MSCGDVSDTLATLLHALRWDGVAASSSTIATGEAPITGTQRPLRNSDATASLLLSGFFASKRQSYHRLGKVMSLFKVKLAVAFLCNYSKYNSTSF